MANAKFCRHCGSPLTSTSHFCANCGVALDGAAPATGGNPSSAAGASGGVAVLLPWFVLASLMMAGLGYVIGSKSAASGAAPASVAAFPEGDPIISAPDISSLSPEERVDRLFNRVMALAAAGKQDSVQFFAPMAINALAALMPLDAHRRYDLGLIQLTAGDPAAARVQSDSILLEQPTHLLGLSLGMRAAKAENRAADAKKLGARLTAAAASERAKGLREYADHAPDIAEAMGEAAGRRTP
jgi:hypothetical protein